MCCESGSSLTLSPPDYSVLMDNDTSNSGGPPLLCSVRVAPCDQIRHPKIVPQRSAVLKTIAELITLELLKS